MRKSILSLVIIVASVISTQLLFEKNASAFQPGRIIDNSVFFNGNTMTTSEVQAFLNSKVPTCDTNHPSSNPSYQPPFTCLKDYRQDSPTKAAESGLCEQYNGGNKSAAEIINDVAQSCGVSEKVLIALLEKEQSLITDTWPWSIQYRSATGYGCPDTAPCDAEYYGFFNQVYNAARQFKRYGRDSTSFRYRAGRENYIQYNPNAGCGGTNVLIQNQATAGLYNYTPYQPNPSVPLNSFGTGDSCGAYGNRNFWKLYNNWFGQSVFITPLLGYAPAVVSQAKGKINTFARGQDFREWQTWYDDSGWQAGWNFIDGPSPQSSAPSAVSWGPGHMDVFETRNGSIWHSWYKADAIGWRGWSSLGNPSGVALGGSVSVVAQSPGKINVFARGSDHRLWQTWYENGHWQSWNYLDGPSPDSSAPTAISWENGHMDIFEVRKGILWHSWYKADAIGWRWWSPLGNPSAAGLVSTPAVVDQTYGKINVFSRGTDSRLWQTWYENGHWQSAWNFIDGSSPASSAPTAISWENGHMDVFETRNGNLWHSYYAPDNTGWRGWQPIGQP